ncbi:MAG: adenylyltransferase [Deltaproteobacteria bacterium GWC2_56_8]|nr:MAG: adenylyltransferase [Deltaproteobacteria bacterium GWB2_55_19]OGP38582.1 MAG: adenylyltransferase [Deltaproteobacteria bacterium GWC2_56_8]HAO93321.1 adenylyltransferase [Deltaproteobacteria bacterium]
MTLSNFFSKNLFHPLWDLKDHSVRLQTLKALEGTQWMGRAELMRVQFARAQEIIRYAYENCAYYRASFDSAGVRPEDIRTGADIRRIPILTKKEIRENAGGLVSGRYRKEDLVSAKTGGSTGKSLTLYFDADCQEMRNAAAIRSDRWANWELGDKKAALWGNPPLADTLKKVLRNALVDRVIYLDTLNLNRKSMSDFVDIYKRYKPTVIFGHSHSLYIFAGFLRDNRISDLKPKGIISTSMMLMPHEREVIEEVFGCAVTNRYGCEEVGLISCECERHNGMHLNIDHLLVEFIKDDGAPAGEQEEGAIVVTDLINRGMPLIRYRIEDVGVYTERSCECGRGLPLMERVAGRVADFLLKKDGSMVAGVSLVERTLTAIKGLEQMQIVQDTVESITIKLVRGADFSEESALELSDEFRRVFGDIEIRIEYVDSIPQERSGKYRFSICRVPGV